MNNIARFFQTKVGANVTKRIYYESRIKMLM